jgi:integrase
MASFFLDKARGTWTCQYKEPTTGKYKARRTDNDGNPFKRKKDAVEWYHNSGFDLEAGNIKPTGDMTVGEWLQEWWESYCTEQDMEPSTRRGYKIAIDNHVIPEIGSLRLADLRQHHVKKMLANLMQKKKPAKDKEKAPTLKPSYINQIYRCFQAAINQAVEDDMIRKNPCTKVPALSMPDPKPNYCTAETIQAAIKEMEASETKFFMPIYICIMLGYRRGEALGLKWDDIEGNVAHLHMQVAVEAIFEDGKPHRTIAYKKTKTKRSIRDSILPADLMAALQRHRKRQLEQKLMYGPAYQDEGFVCADIGGGVLNPDSVTRAAREFLKKVGAKPGTHLHDLRHTYGTLTYQAGYPIDVVADLLGDSIRTAQKYYIGEDSKRKHDAALTVNELFKVK